MRHQGRRLLHCGNNSDYYHPPDASERIFHGMLCCCVHLSDTMNPCILNYNLHYDAHLCHKQYHCECFVHFYLHTCFSLVDRILKHCCLFYFYFESFNRFIVWYSVWTYCLVSSVNVTKSSLSRWFLQVTAVIPVYIPVMSGQLLNWLFRDLSTFNFYFFSCPSYRPS